MKKKLSIWIILVAIVSTILVILNTNSKLVDVICGIAIGMNIALLIDKLLANKKIK